MAVSRNIKTRDLQTVNVILDFKKLEVVKANMDGVSVPKDFNRIVEYYHKHYASTSERLFAENGYEIVKPQEPESQPASEVANEKQDNPN
jgi:hypothetical protein